MFCGLFWHHHAQYRPSQPVGQGQDYRGRLHQAVQRHELRQRPGQRLLGKMKCIMCVI